MKTDDVFFALLRAGLWGKAEDISLRDVDWESVYGIAREQTVAGFVADGISVMKKADPAMAVSPAVQNAFMQTVGREPSPHPSYSLAGFPFQVVRS